MSITLKNKINDFLSLIDYFETYLNYFEIMSEVKFEYYDSKKTKAKYELYCINGSVLHREEDKPAFIHYYPSESNENGTIECEIYFINGSRHREGDKPAFIQYYPSECGKNGNIKKEWYYINGDYDREGNKPNKIEYSEDGNIITEMWMSGDGRTELKRNVIDLTLEFTKPCRD